MGWEHDFQEGMRRAIDHHLDQRAVNASLAIVREMTEENGYPQFRCEIVNGTGDIWCTVTPDHTATNYFLIPTMDSLVWVDYIDKHNGIIVGVSLVDKAYYAASSLLWFRSDNQIQFNDGKNGGIPIASNIAERLNRVETALNDFIKYIGSLPIPVNGSVSTAPDPQIIITYKIPDDKLTTSSDLENSQIAH